jgi:hypothetical protein
MKDIHRGHMTLSVKVFCVFFLRSERMPILTTSAYHCSREREGREGVGRRRGKMKRRRRREEEEGGRRRRRRRRENREREQSGETERDTSQIVSLCPSPGNSW